MIKRQRDIERKRESDNITSVLISVWINIVGYCKTNNHATFKQVILKFASFALKIECLSMYRINGVFEKKNCKKKCKQIKKSGKYQHSKKCVS